MTAARSPRPPDDTELHRRLVDLSGDLLFTADLDGRLTYVNDAFARTLHHPAADLVGREALSLIRDDARDEARAFYCRQLERGLSDTYFELPLVTRGQATIWVGLHLRIVVADGQPRHLEGAARDVTDRRRIEDALQQSDERYRQAFDENLAGIFVASPSGQIRSCNPAFVQICGFPSLADALGANLGALYPDGGLATMVDRVRRDGAVRQHESTLCRVDGRVVPVIESLVGRFDADGDLMSINGYVFDDSPRKDLEGQMRQSQKMEALGRLAGGVAHDFNNVLMVISGYSETVLEALPAARTATREATRSSRRRRATALTRSSWRSAGQRVQVPEVFDLNGIVRDAPGMLRRLIDEDIALRVEPSPTPVVIVDPAQLEQVLLNLALNARDAMPDGGELRIIDDRAARPTRIGRDCWRRRKWCIAVTDTGRDVARPAGAHLRAVLHDQGRQRHRPRAVDRLRHRRGERRPHHRRKPVAARHYVRTACRSRCHQSSPSAATRIRSMRSASTPIAAHGRCWSSRTKRRCGISSRAPCSAPATRCCRPRTQPRRWPACAATGRPSICC